jgi:cell division protein FtsI (penicillin-binding protein 3)
MMTIAGAIEDGQVGPETQRRVPDHLQMANKTFRDHDTHPTELWTTTDILSNSSNIGTIQIAQALGAPKLDRYLRSFGLGQATGSDIPGEVKGLLPAVGTWSGTSLGSIAIGQTVAVTPLQLLAAYNTIDNGGIYVAPHVIGSTDRGNGKQATVQPTSRRVVSEKTASAVEAMLAKVVADGTGKEAVVPGYVAYGKTGTARIPQANPTDPTDGYLTPEGTYQYASTFIGGIRGADLTMVVTLKDPKTVTTGGEAAAPVFGQLAALALRTLKIPPQVVGADPLAEVPELSPSAKADVAGNPTSGDDGTQG